jgi:hypothetical protein
MYNVHMYIEAIHVFYFIIYEYNSPVLTTFLSINSYNTVSPIGTRPQKIRSSSNQSF